MIFAIQVTAIPQSIPAYFIDCGLDLPMARRYWNQLAPAAQVLDSNPERSVALFGRISKVNSDIYVQLPEWSKLVEQPGVRSVAAAGFSYVYMDQDWWKGLSPELQQGYQGACVKLVDQTQAQDGARFRRLYDIRACK